MKRAFLYGILAVNLVLSLALSDWSEALGWGLALFNLSQLYSLADAIDARNLRS